MDRSQIENAAERRARRPTGVDEALERLRDLPFEDLGFAKLDHHRALRTGMPEVIFAESKTRRRLLQSLRAWPTPAATFWPRAPPDRSTTQSSPRSRAPNS